MGAVLENMMEDSVFFGLVMCGAATMFATRLWQTQLFSLLPMVRTNTTRDNLFYNEELQAELKVWQIWIATVETALMREVKRSRNYSWRGFQCAECMVMRTHARQAGGRSTLAVNEPWSLNDRAKGTMYKVSSYNRRYVR